MLLAGGEVHEGCIYIYIYISLVAGMEIFMLHINIYICLYTFLFAAVQIEWVQVECTKNAYV